jgi:hypothetical protein
MTIDLGTIDGLISNVFIFGPGVVLALGVRRLIRKGFFGPNQR